MPTTSRATCCTASAQLLQDVQDRPSTGRQSMLPTEAAAYISRTTYDALNRPIDADHARRQRHPPRLQRGQPARTRSMSTSAAQPRPATGLRRRTSTTTPRASARAIDYGNGVTTSYEYDPLTFRLTHLLTRRDAGAFPGRLPAASSRRLARLPGAEPPLHLRPGGQHHPHPRRRAADHLLPQQARRAERRLHLRRHLPPDRSHRPRAPGTDGGHPNAPTPPDAFNAFPCRPQPPRRRQAPWAPISSATVTTSSATSRPWSIAAPTPPTTAGRALTPTTSRASSSQAR